MERVRRGDFDCWWREIRQESSDRVHEWRSLGNGVWIRLGQHSCLTEPCTEAAEHDRSVSCLSENDESFGSNGKVLSSELGKSQTSICWYGANALLDAQYL